MAPGFVDIHTHYDAQILWDRMLSISPWHGVTTVVMGNCGFGVAPTRPQHRELILRTLEKVEGMSFDALTAGLGADWPFETFPEYLDAIERRGVAINVGALLGHTPLRLYVMGEEATERAATPEETQRMRALVREALAAGAVGFATSKSPTHVGWAGRPVPSRLAELDELRALAGALGDAGAGVLQATLGRGLLFDELGQLAAETGRPVSWTALLAGAGGPGSHRGALERARAAAASRAAGHPAGLVPAAQLRVPVEGAVPVREHEDFRAHLERRPRRQAADLPRSRVPARVPREHRHRLRSRARGLVGAHLDRERAHRARPGRAPARRGRARTRRAPARSRARSRHRLASSRRASASRS